jgi:hypothetical protein
LEDKPWHFHDGLDQTGPFDKDELIEKIKEIWAVAPMGSETGIIEIGKSMKPIYLWASPWPKWKEITSWEELEGILKRQPRQRFLSASGGIQTRGGGATLKPASEGKTSKKPFAELTSKLSKISFGKKKLKAAEKLEPPTGTDSDIPAGPGAHPLPEIPSGLGMENKEVADHLSKVAGDTYASAEETQSAPPQEMPPERKPILFFVPMITLAFVFLMFALVVFPELPEIMSLAEQVQSEKAGKKIITPKNPSKVTNSKHPNANKTPPPAAKGGTNPFKNLNQKTKSEVALEKKFKALGNELGYNFIVAIVLGFLMGIAVLFLSWRQIKDVNMIIGEERFAFWKFLVLPMVTFGIYMIFFEYKFSQAISEEASRRGVKSGESLSVASLVLAFFGFMPVAQALQQNTINSIIKSS